MVTKLTKWGNSLAIRVPGKFIKEINLKENENLEITNENGNLLIKPIIKKKLRMTMEELTEGMTPEGVSSQFLEWDDVGKEIIE